MSRTIILETDRLILSEFTLDHTEFIITLVNSPNWLQFIGDRNIKTAKDAQQYISKSLIKSYTDNGFGLWMVTLKDLKIPIGMCGLINRDTLDDIDIGFAMLPDYAHKGYGYEIALATLHYARQTLDIQKIVAITDSENVASIALLNKIGLQFEKTLRLSEDDNVLLFSTTKS